MVLGDEIAALQARVLASSQAVQQGDPVNLEEVQQAVERLCQQAAALPSQDRTHIKDALGEILATLDSMALTPTVQAEDIRNSLSHTTKNHHAVRAYINAKKADPE